MVELAEIYTTSSCAKFLIITPTLNFSFRLAFKSFDIWFGSFGSFRLNRFDGL